MVVARLVVVVRPVDVGGAVGGSGQGVVVGGAVGGSGHGVVVEPITRQLARLKASKLVTKENENGILNLLWPVTPVVFGTPMLTSWAIAFNRSSPAACEESRAVIRMRNVNWWFGVSRWTG